MRLGLTRANSCQLLPGASSVCERDFRYGSLTHGDARVAVAGFCEGFMPDCSHVLVETLRNPENGWSVGTFGATGEFMRDRDEPCVQDLAHSSVSLVPGRVAIYVLTRLDVVALDYETFESG
jgi:hypothetical protein